MEAIIIVPVVFFTFYLIIELLVHRRERLMMIDKLSQNQLLDLSKLNMFKGLNMGFSGLKLGCLLCGLGLGFLLAYVLSFVLLDNMKADYFHVDRTLSMACVLIFGGLGLIVAYFIERPKK